MKKFLVHVHAIERAYIRLVVKYIPTEVDIGEWYFTCTNNRGGKKMNLDSITLQALPTITGLNKESARNYFHAKLQSAPILKRCVVAPFENLLRETTGYTDENLPAGKQVTQMTHGPVSLTIESETGVKRPRLQAVYVGIVGFLNFVTDDHQEGISRRGVRTIGGTPYIALEQVIGKIDELRAGVTTNQVKHSVKHTYEGGYPNTPLVVTLDADMRLCEADAVLYAHAVHLSKGLGKDQIKVFEDLLKSQTGYDKENVPEKTEEKWIQVGKHQFAVRSVREETPKYSDVLADLTKPIPTKITSRSKMGELMMVQAGINFPENEAYGKITLEGKSYVSIDGVKKRLVALKELHTNPSVNQSIGYFPAF
jgi:hypothetical protein